MLNRLEYALNTELYTISEMIFDKLPFNEHKLDINAEKA